MVDLVCAAGAIIGESPVWHSNRLMWTDPVERQLHAFEDTCGHTSVAVEMSVWALAHGPDGVVGTLDNAFCAVSDRGEVASGPQASIPEGCRFNDLAVDSHGGLWAGVMHRGVLATRGRIVHAPSAQDKPIEVASGLGVPNGMAFGNDHRLYVVDTLSRTLLAYPVEADSLGQPTIVTDFLNVPGKPDGMTIGADGSFWVAMWGGGCVAQIAPDGAFLRTLSVPAPHVSSVCLVGETELYVTTSRMRLSPSALDEFPGSGGLFRLNVGGRA